MTKFAFFGCWNETQYRSEDPKENDAPCFKLQENETKTKCDEFSTVLQEIKQQSDINFIVVAGDNYYPQKKTEKDKDGKKTKTKTFSQDDFNKGFEALKSIDKPTYLLLGNHDLDNIMPKIKDKSKIKSKKGGNSEEEEKKKNCSIMEAEVNFVKDSKIKLFDYKTELIVEEKHDMNTLYIMIDTNNCVVSEDWDCYPSLLHENEKRLDRTQLIEKQKVMVQRIIYNHKEKNKNKPITKVCFFGHHPLLCLKQKNQDIILEDNMEWNRFLFNVIIDNELQKIPNIYYFCADLHQYQEGVVTIQNNTHIINIHQFISGTGGAFMDPEIQPNEITEKHLREISIGDIHSSYRMIHSIEKNGFLIIDDTSPVLNVVFHPVYFFKKEKSLSHLSSLRSRSRRQSHYLSRRGNQGIIRSNSLGGKTRRIKRKSKKNKH